MLISLFRHKINKIICISSLKHQKTVLWFFCRSDGVSLKSFRVSVIRRGMFSFSIAHPDGTSLRVPMDKRVGKNI